MELTGGSELRDESALTTIFRGLMFHAERRFGFDDGAAKFRRAEQDDLAGFGPLRRNDYGNSGLEDARLFAGDFANRMAEEIFVVEVNGRDEGNGGNDDIGGVETPAQADFEDGEVDASARESLEGHGGEAFEISRVSAEFSGGEELLDEMVNAGEDCGEGSVGDLFVGWSDARVDAVEVMRR